MVSVSEVALATGVSTRHVLDVPMHYRDFIIKGKTFQ